MTDPTLLFSGRVKHYAEYRPRYPREIITVLREACGFTSLSTIADIGSGTGFLSELFLQNGNPVAAVEPNPEMRKAGEKLLSRYRGFRSIAGRAESTTLNNHSMDFIVTGQSFHWFEIDLTRKEFTRILKPNGVVMVVWNERDTGPALFLKAFEDLLKQHVPDYERLNFRQVYDTSVARFFGKHGYQSKTFRYRQELDSTGTKGRLLSYSYVPEEGHPNYAPMLRELSEIFDTFQVDGRVAFEYTTRMYYGRLSERTETLRTEIMTI